MLNKEDFVNYLYYKVIPEVYRVEDQNYDFVLKNYLTALVDKGYDYIIQKSNSFKDICNPEKCPDEIFPYLYESSGLTYQNSIDMKYQRKILKNIGELNRRRGTYNSVVFLVRVLTQVDVGLQYEKITDGGTGITTKNLCVTLKADTLDQVQEMDTKISVVQNFIKSQIPYNINPIVEANVRTQVVESKQYYTNIVGSCYEYNLVFQ